LPVLSADGLVLQKDVGVSTFDLVLLDFAKAVGDARGNRLVLVEGSTEGHTKHRRLQTCGPGERLYGKICPPKQTCQKFRRLSDTREPTPKLTIVMSQKPRSRKLAECLPCRVGRYQDDSNHDERVCKTARRAMRAKGLTVDQVQPLLQDVPLVLQGSIKANRIVCFNVNFVWGDAILDFRSAVIRPMVIKYVQNVE
jgi:hypothetical protein